LSPDLLQAEILKVEAFSEAAGLIIKDVLERKRPACAGLFALLAGSIR
jgi:hypothetical protein